MTTDNIPTADPSATAEDAPPPVDSGAFLDLPDALAQLAAMDRPTLVNAASRAVGSARANPTALSLARLGVLRRGLLMANEREALAMCLGAQGQLALLLGDFALAATAFDSLWGTRELLGQPWRAHEARLAFAEATALTGDTAGAERLLTAAMGPARELARTGEVARASALLADTLALLAAVLEHVGRTDEATLWREGAVDMAPDADSRDRVLARTLEVSGGGAPRQL